MKYLITNKITQRLRHITTFMTRDIFYYKTFISREHLCCEISLLDIATKHYYNLLHFIKLYCSRNLIKYFPFFVQNTYGDCHVKY